MVVAVSVDFDLHHRIGRVSGVSTPTCLSPHAKIRSLTNGECRIFVAVPKMIQSRINKAKLSIQGLKITQTQSQNFTMAINGTVEADSSVYAVIDSFEGKMYLEDWAPQTPFVSVTFPQTTSASETAVNITQFTEILDLDAFTIFNEWLLTNSSLNVSVEGKTHVKISGISHKYPINFKKTLNIAGLDSFSGFSVPNSSVSTSADSQGDNFFGTVIIPNPSFVSFEIVRLFAWRPPCLE